MGILNYLDGLEVKYELYEHVEVYTVEEAKTHTSHIEGMHFKNLFLRDRKGKQHFLVILSEDKLVDLKELSKKLNVSNLSFASEERLFKYLRLLPGSVGPFGLIYDVDNHVKVVLDEKVLDQEYVTFHPNRNSATVKLKSSDLIRYLEIQGYDIVFTD